MHSTTYNGRKIRAYKTEGMAKSQAKRWNAPFQTRVKGTGQWSGGEFENWEISRHQMSVADELIVKALK